jgi:hypothetical protein
MVVLLGLLLLLFFIVVINPMVVGVMFLSVNWIWVLMNEHDLPDLIDVFLLAIMCVIVWAEVFGFFYLVVKLKSYLK